MPEATRRRLTPDARRDQLLDTAKAMIVEAGLQAFSIEALARTAGVSSQLVYNHFASRLELLRALLVRENEAHRARIAADLAGATTFVEVARVFVAANYDDRRPGEILTVLSSQPELAEAVEEAAREDHRSSARLLLRTLPEVQELSRREAELALALASGASVAAGGLAHRLGLDREEAIDATMRFILAGIEALGD